ncbi:MAG TPA: alpha/beta fold hydrolase [Thermomicrobiales bacterium]|nr:alpha/beta fold hydrolase [Thermomicrobiales bacterium]
MPNAPEPPPGLGLTRFARRGAAGIAYEAVGADDASAVLLLHDLLADRAGFAPLRDALVAAGFRIVAPDLRGHGASGALSGRPYPMVELTADALAVLDAAAAPRAHIVGAGLGGAIALALAEAAPTRVASLAVLAPAIPGILGPDADRSARVAAAVSATAAAEAAALAIKGQTDRALDRWLEPQWGRGWRERLPRARRGAIRRHAGALGPLLGAAATHTPPAAVLAALDRPLLVVLAADAGPLDRAIADRLASDAGARTAIVPAAAGPPDAVDLAAETVFAALTTFLGDVRANPNG